MIPLGDDIPLRERPWATRGLLLCIAAAWVLLQGAGLDVMRLAASVCNLGMVAGEITRAAPLGTAVHIGPDLACVVDDQPINYLTPLTSMFLHGGWAHLLGNALFLWVFGRHVENGMGRGRFVVFYVLCGLAAAAAQIAVDPSSPVPLVGASGAISGVMGAYLIMYPRARVNMLFIIVIFVRVIPLPAWLVLLYWFGLQLVLALPQLAGAENAVTSGVAVVAHVGGFIAGLALVWLFRRAPRPDGRHGAWVSGPRPYASAPPAR
jgi:membrane associated rhomboid family serine protease